jgi:hypothetical protein
MRMHCFERWASTAFLPALLGTVLAAGCGDSGDGGDGGDPEPNLDPPGDPVSDARSDEFDDPATLSRWRVWSQVQGEDPRHDLLDIAQTNPGHLTLRPKAGGWYGTYQGPLVYTMVRGDFRVETWVSAAKLGNPDAPPDQQFNSAGLLARDPEHGPGHDDWVMVNTGRQLGDLVGSEGKTTVGSQSTLELVEGPHRGRLRICRVGGAVVLARRLEGEAAWRLLNRYDRADLPEDLQVGMVATAWNTAEPEPNLAGTPDIEATFDYVRFSVPGGEGDCVAE